MDDALLRKHGAAVAKSTGVVKGTVQKLDQKHLFIQEYHITEQEVVHECERFNIAVQQASVLLQEETDQLAKHQYASELVPILETHRMMLHDPELKRATITSIKHKQINAEWALKRCLKRIEQSFDQIADPYFRSRKADVEHVGKRIFDCLSGDEQPQQQSQSIMVAMDFSPADIVSMWRSGVLGFISIQGGINSHAMIVASGVGLPGLAGVKDLFDAVEDGQTLLLDAEQGVWILNPNQDDITQLSQLQNALAKQQQLLQYYACQPSISGAGQALPLMANIEFVEEVETANQHGVDGIGLFRTEFPFMQAETFPDENLQFEYYAQVVRGMQGKPVVFRLLDIGADKLIPIVVEGGFDGENPALGLRGVRLLLQYPELLKTQLRAIVKTADFSTISILIPMVSSVAEVVAVRTMLDAVKKELGVKKHIDLGCMIEVPAVVFIASELAKVSDFFSIGSNDLVQYSLAVDRTDDYVSYLYDVNHPAILQLIEMTVSAAANQNIPVAICGELAANPEWLNTFLRLGVTSLSMSPRHILPMRKQLHQL